MTETDSGLWVPSDDLLREDPIAALKVDSPFEAPELEEHGVLLPDVGGDALADEAASAMVIAEAEMASVVDARPEQRFEDDPDEDPEDETEADA